MEQLIKRLRDQGFSVTKLRRNQHYKVEKGGKIHFLSHSPSDPRSLANAISDLRKIGFRE